jgi:hypothetical protein
LIALAIAAALLSGVALAPGAAGIGVGLALSGTAWTAGLLLFGASGPWSDVLVLALAVPFGILRLRHPGDPGTPTQLRREFRMVSPDLPDLEDAAVARWLGVACALAATVVAALFVEHSIRYPDGGWDASAIWNLRARWLYAAPDRLHDVFSPEFPAQHPDYPLMLPGLIAHLWTAVGSWTPVVPIVVSAAFAAVAPLALGRAVATRGGKLAGLCAALLLLGTPDFLTLAWNQYADLKLAVLLLAAVVLATDERLAAAGLVAGLAAFTKNEGILEAVALLVAVLVRSGPRGAARFLLGAASPFALLLYFKLRWAPPNDLLARTSILDAVTRAPGRIPLVARGFLAEAVDFSHWGCALGAVALAWMARWPKRERGHLAVAFVALVLPIFFAVYLVTPWDPNLHLAVSLDRLLFQLWPAILFASALALLPAAQPAR